MSKRKYAVGEVITSLNELYHQPFVYLGNRGNITQQKGWFQNWQLRFAQNCIDRKLLFKPVLIENVEETK